MKKNLLFCLSLLLLPFMSLSQIQPEWQWSKQATGAGGSLRRSIAKDRHGNTYVRGDFSGTANFESQTLISTGGTDIFIIKYDADGNLLWAKQAGGSGADSGTGIAIDANENVYVAGYFTATAAFGSVNLTSSGGTDIFLAKYSSEGEVIWAKSAGGSSTDNCLSIALDANSNAYITGNFSGTATFGSTTFTRRGPLDWTMDIFTAKYDVDGNVVWAKQAGGSFWDTGFGIAVDANNNVYVTGSFGQFSGSETGTATFDSTTLTCGGSGGSDIFTAKYDPDGNIVWAKNSGGNGNTSYSIALDSNNNAYITGKFNTRADFGSATLTNANGHSVFIAKYDACGNALWAKSAGGNGDEISYGISVDDNRNAYITGYFEQAAGFGPQTLTSNGGTDVFVAKYNEKGEEIWAISAGGSDGDIGNSIVTDKDFAFVTGEFSGTASFGPTSLAGISPSTFVTKLVFPSTILPATISKSSLEQNVLALGQQIHISFTTTGVYEQGNSFTAQLSDASGSFLNPVTIGTSTCTTVLATIPSNTDPGPGYRIRVISTSPVVTGDNNGSDIEIIAQPFITTQPTSRIITGGQGTSFNVEAFGSGISYQWQESRDQGNSFTDISNGLAYSGANTAALTLTKAPISMNGYQYRVIINNGSPVYSNIATLTVHVPAFDNARTWQYIGAPGMSYGDADYTKLVYAADNTPFIAYNDIKDGGVIVKKYQGNNWEYVGPPGIPAGQVYSLNLLLDANGFPFIAYEDVNTGNATVKKLDGSNWVDVGGGWASAGPASFPCLKLDPEGVPYIAYADNLNGGKLTLRKFTGGSWIDVGTAGFSSGPASDIYLTFDTNAVPYVAFRDEAGNGKATVMKFAADTWVNVGSAAFSVGGAQDINLAIDYNGTPFISFMDQGDGNQAKVKKYTGINWEDVGFPAIEEEPAYYISLALDASGTPFVAFRNDANKYEGNGKATVKKFNGTSWVDVGKPGISNGMTFYVSLALDATATPTVAFKEYASGKAMVMKFGEVAPIISAHPMPVTISGGENTSFKVTATFAGELSYQWQESRDGGRTFNNISNGFVYTGATTAHLNLANAPISMNSYQYRVVVSNGNSTTSNVAGLTVNVPGFDNAGVWQTVGTPRFSAGSIEFTDLGISTDNIPFIVFRDNGRDGKAILKKYMNGNWVDVGPYGVSGNNAYYTKIALDSTGIPIVAFTDDENDHKATVKKFDGNNWVYVGSPGFSAGLAPYITIALDADGIPFVAYLDGANNQKVTVKKFDGNEWVLVGAAGFSDGGGQYLNLAIDPNGTPFVGYTDWANKGGVTVKKFDGNSWINVGSPGFTPIASEFTSLGLDANGTPYIAYEDETNNKKVTVKVFAGGSWKDVGPDGFTNGQDGGTTHRRLTFALDQSGTPFIAYQDSGNGYKATVKKFDGTSWVDVGNAGFTEGATGSISLVFDNTNTPFFASADHQANGNKATVLKYVPAPAIATSSLGTTDLCLGTAVGVSFTTTGTFASDNVFTAQLFDTSGSFASAEVIGSLTSATSGTINAVIPANTPPAATYRIRVVASDPETLGTDNGADLSIGTNISTTWTGQVSHSWYNAGNWTCGVPTKKIHVYVPANLTNFPKIDSDTATVKNIEINGTLTISGGSLKLYGSLNNNGSFNHTGGNIFFSATEGTQQIPGLEYQNVYIEGAAEKVLVGNATINGKLTFKNGKLKAPANTKLILKGNLASEDIAQHFEGELNNENSIAGAGSNNFGNMGLVFDNTGGGDWGNVSISRITGQEVADIPEKAIKRQWVITPEKKANTSVDLTLSWLESDNNDLDFSSSLAQVWKKPENSSAWERVGTPQEITKNGNLNSVTIQTNAFSTWAITRDNTVLPVTWLSFKAAPKPQGISLTWATAMEENSEAFIIERSFNGKDFVEIASIKAAGNSIQVQNYHYLDKDDFPSNSKNVYYRLRQLDFDGSNSYSAMVPVKVDGKGSIGLIMAYPNPFARQITLKMNTKCTAIESDEVRLYSLTGKLLYRHSLAARMDNRDFMLQNLPDLPLGIYLIYVNLHGKQSVFKMVKE